MCMEITLVTPSLEYASGKMQNTKSSAGIVIIEDDIEICEMVKKFLSSYKYKVDYANTGSDGIKLCQKLLPDMVVLDLMLPCLSGEKVLAELREFTDCPVIVVSAKTMVQSKIELLRSGADDYITKPFNLYELLARIEANLKRNINIYPGTDTCLSYRDMTIKGDNVFLSGKPVQFTSTELKILKLLVKYPGKIFSKQNLYESVWHEEYAFDNDTINTHISNLRRKIKIHTHEDYIETVWGIGYKIM